MAGQQRLAELVGRRQGHQRFYSLHPIGLHQSGAMGKCTARNRAQFPSEVDQSGIVLAGFDLRHHRPAPLGQRFKPPSGHHFRTAERPCWHMS